MIQANAAGAEESASAAKELNLLACRTRHAVSELAALVGGIRLIPRTSRTFCEMSAIRKGFWRPWGWVVPYLIVQKLPDTH